MLKVVVAPCHSHVAPSRHSCHCPADYRSLKEQFCASTPSLRLLAAYSPPGAAAFPTPNGQVLLMQIVCRGLPNFREVSERPQRSPCLFANTINHFLFLPQPPRLLPAPGPQM